MTRARTTVDTWELHVHYGHGWEHECTEFTRRAINARVREYHANAPNYPVKVVPKRLAVAGLTDAERRDIAQAVQDAAAARAADRRARVLARHRAADPHCTCNDCIAFHAARKDATS